MLYDVRWRVVCGEKLKPLTFQYGGYNDQEIKNW